MIETNIRIAAIDKENEKAWRIVRSQTVKAIETAEQTLKESEEKNYSVGIAWAKAIIGGGHTWLGNFDEAMQYNLEAIKLLIDCGELKAAVQAYYNLAVLYHFIGDFDEQIHYFEKSLELAKEIGDENGIANALNGIGTTKYTQNNTKEALEYLGQAIKIAEKTGDKHTISKIYDGIGQCHFIDKDFKKALTYKNKVLEVLDNQENSQVLSYAHEGLGEIYSELGDMKNSLKHFRKSLELRDESGFRLGLGQTTVKIAGLYLKMEDYDEALRYYKSGLVIAEEMDSEQLIWQAHLGLSKVYEKRGNMSLFARHYKAHHETRQEFDKKREDKKIRAVELKSRFEKVQLEKEELEKKNKELQQYFEDVRTLSSIGNEITSTIELEDIFNIIYERINSLMDAQGIFIGICNYDKNVIEVKLALDNGVRDNYFEYSLDDVNKKLPVWAVVNGSDVHINDYKQEVTEYLSDGEEIIQDAPNSVVVIPLRVKEQTIGLLFAQSGQLNAFSKHHFNILKSFANYIAIAIDNATLYQSMDEKIRERTAKLEQTYKDSETLNKIGQELISTLNFDAVFDRLYTSVNELMDATIFSVRIYDPENEVIEYKYGYEEGELLNPISVPMSNKSNLSVWCIKNNKELVIGDNKVESKKYVGDNVDVVDGNFPHSIIMYPLRKGDEVLGLISVQSFEKHAYTDYHLSIVKTLAHYTTISLENARSYEILEKRVKERTSEIEKKSEEIKRSYQNTKLLSEVGKEISSMLSSSDIIAKVYSNLNDLMDATIFGIGIYRDNEEELHFSGAMEKGVLLDDFSYSTKEEKIATLCFKSSKEIVINDWEKELTKYVSADYDAAQGDMPESMIYLPLISKEKTLGVLTVQSFEKGIYSDYHLNILRSLSVYIGSALENAGLYQSMEDRVIERTAELQQTYKNAETLNRIGQELISTLNFEDVFEHLYKNVNKLMDASVFGVRVLDEEKQVVHYKYEYENGERLSSIAVPLKDKDNLSVWCIENNEPIIAKNIVEEAAKYIGTAPKAVKGEVTNSVIFYPLRSPNEEGKVLGAITIQSFEEDAYKDHHVNIVETLAQYTVIAFENANRYEMMEERVQERTSEIQKSYENTKLSSEIGKEVSAEIQIDKIVQKVYNRVNNLMAASIFGIGVYRKEQDDLLFSGTMEKGKKLSDYSYPISEAKIATLCFKKSEDFIINDWDAEFQQYLEEDYEATEGEMPESMIYLPLISKGNTIGVLTVQSFDKNTYSDYHLNILKTLSVYVAGAMENAQLYKGLEDRVRERTAEIQKAHQDTKRLSEISKVIAETLNIETIISRVYENINTLMDATCFGVGIYDPDNNQLVMPGFIENGKGMERFTYNIDDERLATWCFKKGEEVFISNYFEEYDRYIKGIKSPVSGKDSTSIIYIPLLQQDKKIGVLTVQSYEAHVYSDYHLDILRSLANSIATAIDNARLYENLEEEVKERTQEVVEQKEQIEKTFENTKLLSEIGKSITSQITVEGIIEVVYEQINKLMDAEGFGIGVYNQEKNAITFPGYIESGERLADVDYHLVKDSERLSCVCFNKDREILINNLEQEYHEFMDEYLPPVSGKACVSIIYLPIKSKSKKIGVITVQSFDKYAYTDYHFDILRTIGVYTGIALDNAALYANMEERVKERTAEIEKAHQDTKLISQISKDIAESLNVETIIARVYENVNSLMDASCFGIGIYDKESNMIRMPGFIENGTHLEGVEFDLSDEKRFASWCFHNRKEIHISDYINEYDKYIKLEKTPVQGEGTNSIIYLPLVLKEKVIGVITVQSFEKDAYSQYHVDILGSLATTIASAIENALLYESLEDKVNERTLELLKQKEIIEEKNKNITDSIVYAKRIQDATLPDIDLVRSYLDKSFVLFRPKDIVSGDFYWIEKVGNTILFAVCDCTGHGVPGAFLSLIGHNALNQIVNELKIIEPGKILDELNKKVHKTLQNSLEKTSIKDGMDMSFCSLNLDTNELKFAGAYNPLYLVRNNEIEVIKGDKMAIGSHLDAPFNFETKEITLQEGDSIYLFSDGYADQFGGPRGKKFKYSRFKELLVSIHEKDMEEQHEVLCETMDVWQGNLEQLDDLCVIGYKV